MSIDRQRIAAVALLNRLGFRWEGNAWSAPAPMGPTVPNAFLKAADALRNELTYQAEQLAGCTPESPEEERLALIVDLLDAYDVARPTQGAA